MKRDRIWDEDEALDYLEIALEAEGSEAWRALMSRTYYAVMQNQSPHVKHLEVRQLVWKRVSTLYDPDFHYFLSQLEQFTFSIRDDCKEYTYDDWLSELPIRWDKYFFNHLANVKALSVILPDEGPYGLNSMCYHGGFYSKYPQINLMPVLTTLHLVGVEVNHPLADILDGHDNPVKTVTLRSCYAVSKGYQHMSWFKFFDHLCRHLPKQLRHFRLAYSDCRMRAYPYMRQLG